jgi:hypothetical protein
MLEIRGNNFLFFDLVEVQIIPAVGIDDNRKPDPKAVRVVIDFAQVFVSDSNRMCTHCKRWRQSDLLAVIEGSNPKPVGMPGGRLMVASDVDKATCGELRGANDRSRARFRCVRDDLECDPSSIKRGVDGDLNRRRAPSRYAVWEVIPTNYRTDVHHYSFSHA